MSATKFHLNTDGLPFKTKAETIKAIKSRELDPDQFFPARHTSGGYCIVDIFAVAETAQAPIVVAEKPKNCKYFEVVFQHRSDSTEPEDVVISHNGDVIRCRRDVEVILPDYYLALVDTAKYKEYEIKAGKDPYVKGHITRFPYSKGRECSEKEYRVFLAAGNKTQTEELSRRAESN